MPNSAGLKLWTILPHSSRNEISATCAGWFAGAGSSLSVRSRRPLAIGGDQLAIKIGEAFAQIALVQFDAAQINRGRSEEHTSELQSLMRISYAVFCLKKKNKIERVVMSTYLLHELSHHIIND